VAQLKQEKLPEARVRKLAHLIPTLPPVIAREEVGNFLGGLVRPQTLNNADKAGKGPRFRLHVGRKVVYETPYLLEWVEEYFGVTRQDDSLR